jgi:methylmalonyl-CoA mutase N-terminal domain/subunit
MEADANAIIGEIDDMGGVVEGVHKGYFRRAIAEASYRFGQEMEAGDRITVGVNAYTDGNEDHQVEILQIPHSVETDQCDRLASFRAKRDAGAVERSLEAIRTAARDDENTMPALIAAADARCTLGEMVQALADVYGRYTSGPEW